MPASIMSSSDTASQHAADATSAAAITIVLADDHQVVRSGLRVLLESDGRFEVVGESGNVAGTIGRMRACHPRVLVLGINMGGASGLASIT